MGDTNIIVADAMSVLETLADQRAFVKMSWQLKEEAFQLLSKAGSPLCDGRFTFTCISGSQPRSRIGITWGALKKYGY